MTEFSHVTSLSSPTRQTRQKRLLPPTNQSSADVDCDDNDPYADDTFEDEEDSEVSKSTANQKEAGGDENEEEASEVISEVGIESVDDADEDD